MSTKKNYLLKITGLILFLTTAVFFFFNSIEKAQAQGLNAAEKIGNPGLTQFPANTPCDCQARGVKEMQYYNGKIYVGYGYFGYGGPPPTYCGPHVSVRVWQIDSSGGLSVALQTFDEEVRHMFVEDGKLFVSPMDTNLEEALIWILDDSAWQRVSLSWVNKLTLNGFFNNALYVDARQSTGGVGISQLRKSADLGATWQTIFDYRDTGYYIGNAISMGSYLLMMGAKGIDPAHPGVRESGIFKWYTDDTYDFYKITYPASGSNQLADQLSHFQDGVIYVLDYYPYIALKINSELLFLNQFYEGGAARALSGFAQDKNVIDVIVRGNTVYVLSLAPSATNQFRTYIHSSTDLNNWTKEAEFIVPALPYAFEILDSTGDFYVGLGDRNPYDGYADPESGSIYRIAPSTGPSASQEPVITVLGANPLTHAQGSAFIDPGATASDLEDGNLTSQIVVSGDVINSSTPAGSYQIIYQVTDSGGLTAGASRIVQVASGPSFPLQRSLTTGWNLISFPLEPLNTDPEVVFSPLAGKYNSVWDYQPDRGWSFAAPSIPSFFWDLREIRAGRGYWIKMDEPAVLNFTGTAPNPAAIPLKGGQWNLAGYNSLTPKTAGEAMSSVADKINSVWSYDAGTASWSFYAPNYPGDLTIMKPGNGYWIKANQDCLWDANAFVSSFIPSSQREELMVFSPPPLTLPSPDFSASGFGWKSLARSLLASVLQVVHPPNIFTDTPVPEVGFGSYDDSTGLPLAGVSINLFTESGTAVGLGCTTGADAQCQILGFEDEQADETYKLVIARAGYKTINGWSMLKKGTFISAGLTPGSGVVEPAVPVSFSINGDFTTFANSLLNWLAYIVLIGSSLIILIAALLLAFSGGGADKAVLAKKIIKWSLVVLAGALGLKIIWAVIKSLF